MGVKPPLPAPTESSTDRLQTSGESVTGTDLATNISRRTDKTSYSIPEDGSPVTISTRKNRKDREREGALTRASHPSQTSLLIEYFEGGKSPNVNSRPSVRVKVTPSAAKKIQNSHDHIQITEAGGSRKPSYTRRISLGPNTSSGPAAAEVEDDKSISSYTSAAEDSSLAGRAPPVEIEVMHKDQGSDLSAAPVPRNLRYTTHNTSDISSMPPDSLLEENTISMPRRNRSRSLSREELVSTKDTLKTPSRRRSRSLSRERITQKVIEKLGKSPREIIEKKEKRGSGSRSNSTTKEETMESVRLPKRRSSRQKEELQSDLDPSLLTTSDKRKSADQYSFRSGTSKSSINNPKLLETVEDAIRRLILPELNQLRKDQKTQGNRSDFDRVQRGSIDSGSSVSREELTKKVSKHASAPNVSGKPKVVLNRDDNNSGTILSGNSIKSKKEYRRDRDIDSPSSRSHDRGLSEETVIRDGERMPRKGSGHRLKDAAAVAAIGGVLTHAALKHHDSKSSVDREDRRRRRRRSKSHSRSASVAESTDDIFQKHDVPPMPMRSEITTSDMTRDSILSERTSTPTSERERRRHEIREVARGSSKGFMSPTLRTPPRSPAARRHGLGTHHSSLSREHVREQKEIIDQNHDDDVHYMSAEEAAIAAAGVAAMGTGAAEHHPGRYDHSHKNRAMNQELSPIQSVDSLREQSEPPNRDSFRHNHSSGSLSSAGQQHHKNSAVSLDSLGSAANAKFDHSKRPRGIHLEDDKDVLEPHHIEDMQGSRSPGEPSIDEWYDKQHLENDRYRDSIGSGSVRDPTIDVKHMTNYTDDSLEAPYLDKVTAAQQIRAVGGNAEYIHTPEAVESAVASLHDPSVLDVHSMQSGRSRGGEPSYIESPTDGRNDTERYPIASSKGIDTADGLGIRHQRQSEESIHSTSRGTRKGLAATVSPRQSIARSLEQEEEQIPMGATGLPVADDPIPEIGHGLESPTESDINTNPSIIQGPMGGVPHENRDHWPYQPTPPQTGRDLARSNDRTAHHDSLKAAAAGMLNAAALASREKQDVPEDGNAREISGVDRAPSASIAREDDNHHSLDPIGDSYMKGQPVPTPPMAKDEGYISGANPRSPGTFPRGMKAPALFDDDGIDDSLAGDDPFISQSHMRHLSGNSHGMPSPLYDSATGRGIDRIQSKDVVALMDHLTVRDAQRNARDTEILVTLVRSAAEMRNSFEDMKKFIAEQDDMVMDTGDRQHQKTVQKIIGGPRPQPLGTPRFPRQSSEGDEAMVDSNTKRRNVFRRALKGLGSRSTNDLGKIEDMLVQLLGEVEGLKAGQDIRPSAGGARAKSFDSYENMRASGPVDQGYEPEGQAGTSSTGNQSGYFSNPPSRQGGLRSFDGRRGSQNRVSTVLEGDEDLDTHEQQILDSYENHDGMLTPTREQPRGGSVPLATPPRIHDRPVGTQSNEHTPKTGTDKSRKHKSSSSSFFPKISRWSKTTASSFGDNIRNSGRRERPMSEASRSGSDINYAGNVHYDPQGDDRIQFSDSQRQHERNLGEEDDEHDDRDMIESPNDPNRPPSPLIPSAVSSEAPKWHAHRNSVNLQHPQPRPGQRYQNHLESQAQDYHSHNSPISPTSDQWGSNPTLARYAPGAGGNRLSGGGVGNLSPISDGGYSDASAADQNHQVVAGPPRPPKIRDDGPLVPNKPPKIVAQNEKSQYISPRSSEMLSPEEGGEKYTSESPSYDQGPTSPHSPSNHLGMPMSMSTSMNSPSSRKPSGPRPIAGSGNYSADKIPTSLKQNRYRGTPNPIGSSGEDLTF